MRLFYNGHICACYWLFTLEFAMEMYTKWGANNTMDYDRLGARSEQHLTTVLIETRLTKDILLDEIGEMGKKKRWELTYPTTQEVIFLNACMNAPKAFGYSYSRLCLFASSFSIFPFHTCIGKCIHHRNRSQRRAYKTSALYYNLQTFSFIRSGANNHITVSINDTDSEYRI